MKTTLVLLLAGLLACSAGAQTTPTTPKHHHKNGATNDPADAMAAPDPSADQAAQVALYQKSFVPTDPWRVMKEKTNFAKGPDWVQFEGRVTAVSGDGLVLQGWFGEPLAYMMPNGGGITTTTFLLSNYPRHVGVGLLLSRNDRLVAMKAGTKDDMPNLDYGSVWVPELTDEQKGAAASAKSSKDAKVLAWHEDLAAKGDPYGEYKMGMRYLTGDGVDKDPQKARDLLTKSAAQGNSDAKDALAKMPAN